MDINVNWSKTIYYAFVETQLVNFFLTRFTRVNVYIYILPYPNGKKEGNIQYRDIAQK